MLYLVTVNYDSADWIAKLFASLQGQSPIGYQWLIVNNSPDDTAIRPLAAAHGSIIETGKNLGFGGACNLALRAIYATDPGAIVWLLNPDTTVSVDALETAISILTAHPDLSILGTRVHQPDGAVWFSGGEFNPKNGRIVAERDSAVGDSAYRETDWITGCSLIINLSHFSTCPLFDPDYFLYYEDFDFCRRYLTQGHQLGISDRLCILHHPSSITSRTPFSTLTHSTYSYLLALTKHTSVAVVIYRLGRILGHALRVSIAEPERAIAIIKGVWRYGAWVRSFGKFTID